LFGVSCEVKSLEGAYLCDTETIIMVMGAVRKVEGGRFLVTEVRWEQWVVREKRVERKLERYRGGPGRDYLLIFISFLVQTERWEQKKGKMI